MQDLKQDDDAAVAVEACCASLATKEYALLELAHNILGDVLPRVRSDRALLLTARILVGRASNGPQVPAERQMAARWFLWALHREVAQLPGWERALFNSEVAPSAQLLAGNLIQSSSDCYEWGARLAFLRRAAASGSARKESQLDEADLQQLDALTSDDFSIVLARYLGHAAGELCQAQADEERGPGSSCGLASPR